MLVDKLKPTRTSDLLGQARNVQRIKAWLKTFDPSQSKPIFIYGPPGIGKTTAAHLCCREVGYKVIEFNASDQRNKSTIKDIMGTIGDNTRLNFFGRASETKDAIILDEIDGMAGNEDRGGVGQLILEMKHTKKPMIFICNDGQHQKLRSLKDKCEVIEFKRPDYEAIRALVSKVAASENLRVDKINIKDLAESSDFDIRQIINSLDLFRGSDSNQVAKTTRLNAFEATKKVLTASKHSLDTRYECFFADYNIMPLFMFENYHKNRPVKGDQLKAISRAADAFCLSDFADKQIRSGQHWSLLNTQGLFSTVIPSKLVESHTIGRVDFPQFLGKLSNANKRLRLTQELNAHMCLSLRGGLDADYLEAFRERLSGPLKRDKTGGVDAVVDFMHEYSLTRDDFNSIMELATWSFKPDPMADVDARTKSALTLKYKKESIALPYFVDDKPAKKSKPVGFGAEDEEAEEDQEEEEDVAIKPKKVSKNTKPAKPSKAEKAPAKAEKSTAKAEKAPTKAEKAPAKTEKAPTKPEKATAKPPKKRPVEDDSDTDIEVVEEKVPANKGRAKRGTQNGKSKSPEPKEKKGDENGKPVAERRPPDGGIARFFIAKKQKSS